ncbi:MAG: hypothetical protein J6P72_04305, partial [Firmicutes bacterium]|nr:hypothetical protein [Bacillota bacterium]
MKVLVCVEARGGTLFNGRRQSSDRNVSRDMLKEAGALGEDGKLISPEEAERQGRRLWISPFSRKLFRGKSDYLVVLEDPLREAKEDETFEKGFQSSFSEGMITVFVEDQPLSPYEEAIEELVLYQWNRVYPFDRKLDLDLSGYELVETSQL